MISSRQFILFKWCLISSVFILTTMLLITENHTKHSRLFGITEGLVQETAEAFLNIISAEDWRHFSDQQKGNLSVLGQYLYLDKKPSRINNGPNKKYLIVVWKYGQAIHKRHMLRYTSTEHDPFEDCSVKNCRVSYDDAELNEADAVLFHMQRMKGVKDLPEDFQRPKSQRWVFLTDESPFHTFLTGNVKLEDFNGVFNWSMNYRSDADVPVPYGRTVLLKQNDYKGVEFKKKSDVLITLLTSNCSPKNKRMNYVRDLQKHIDVDVYGGCGTLKCAGHFNVDCSAIDYYKFYLAFENANCPEYITEKLWWNAYSKNSIPIIMGASREECNKLLPPGSYIHVDEFANPSDLARYIIYLNKTMDVYMSYFKWKKYFEIKNEHGYFKSKSYHYCRLCEALNYNDEKEKVYNNLSVYWNKDQCRPAYGTELT